MINSIVFGRVASLIRSCCDGYPTRPDIGIQPSSRFVYGTLFSLTMRGWWGWTRDGRHPLLHLLPARQLLDFPVAWFQNLLRFKLWSTNCVFDIRLKTTLLSDLSRVQTHISPLWQLQPDCAEVTPREPEQVLMGYHVKNTLFRANSGAYTRTTMVFGGLNGPPCRLDSVFQVCSSLAWLVNMIDVILLIGLPLQSIKRNRPWFHITYCRVFNQCPTDWHFWHVYKLC